MKLKDHDECGYPLFYVHPNGYGGYCAKCMNADIVDEWVNPDEITPAINWEDQDLYCASCSHPIDPVYEVPS